ncbi:MAG: hypothetical protein K2X34_00055, partial [Hyphomonadaceae bacterium]|nr:hypothetical protein [Hyphomonadaceae bacterium]
ATALLALCSLVPSRFLNGAAHVREQKLAGFVCALASRLENGFYANADFTLDLRLRQRAAFEAELAALRATGRSPWLIPDGLLDHEGARQAAPRYTISDGCVRWHYEYWLKHVAR